VLNGRAPFDNNGAFKGIQQVQARQARRHDSAARVAALRNKLLRYFYDGEHTGVDHPPIAEFVFSRLSFYEGEQFEVSEIDRAGRYLEDKMLIKFNLGLGSLVKARDRATITPDGEDCVEQFEGDVRKYLNRNGGGVSTNTTNIGTVNKTGAAAFGSMDVTQNVTVGADAAGFAEFARVLLEGFQGLPLDDADLKEQVRAALEEIQSEAKAESEPGRLNAAVGKFWGYMAKAGQPVMTAALMVQAVHYGMPLPPAGS
jgi:hypothetical protein